MIQPIFKFKPRKLQTGEWGLDFTYPPGNTTTFGPFFSKNLARKWARRYIHEIHDWWEEVLNREVAA